jgi:hypothetical protein
VVACLFGFGLTLALVDWLAPTPKGPSSSSYATSPAGLAAYASVLQRSGHPVRRVRTPIAERRPSTGETLIVLEPDVIEEDEAQAIARWVSDGGRLVAGGGDPSWLSQVVPDAPEWRPGGPLRRATLVPVAETADVRTVLGANGGGWRDVGGALPVIGPADGPLLVVTNVGEGSVALLADPSPLQNRRLAYADGAALGVALAGGERRPVAFLETVHGYGSGSGFGGLPGRVKWVIIGLALTALVAIWSVGRRLGPPEDSDIVPSPPRVEYVDALATALVRSKPDQEARS